MNFYYRVVYKDGKSEQVTATQHRVLEKDYHFVLPSGAERRISIGETRSCICIGFEAIRAADVSALGPGARSDIAQKRAS